MMNVFIGHFSDVLEVIIKYIPISLVLVENKPVNKNIIRICKKKNIKYAIIEDYKSLFNELSHIPKIELCFIASFGMILKKDLIRKCKYIINFHPGDIEKIRGRHPLPMAIIERQKLMSITVHLIDSEKIDTGPILAKVMVPIDYNSDYKTNEKHLLSFLKPLAGYVAKYYLKYQRFNSYDWNVKKSEYFNPLDKQKLNHILHAVHLKEIF